MPILKKNDGDGLMKSVMMAYLILILHIVLLMGLGILVFFFRGIVHYMLWIVLFGGVGILASGYWFYRRMKAEGRSLRDTLNSPLFRNKTVEVSLLGGLAQFRVGQSNRPPLLGDDGPDSTRQLEWSGESQVQELTELARLLQSGLITPDEYEQAKQKIFRS
jgi:Short C-terminal domain